MKILAATIVLYSLASSLSAQTADVSVLTCSPARLLPGGVATCTVTLTIAAPPGGTEIQVSTTSRSLVATANSLSVPAGATSATFTVTASPFSDDETAVLTATAVHSVLLSWTASQSPNLSYYNLYRGVVSGGPYPIVTGVGLVTTYTDSNVQLGQSYYYVVTAVDATGVESAYSQEASATLPDAAPQTTALRLCAAARTGVTVPLRCGTLPPGTSENAN